MAPMLSTLGSAEREAVAQARAALARARGETP
jgi:hypothetical protein